MQETPADRPDSIGCDARKAEEPVGVPGAVSGFDDAGAVNMIEGRAGSGLTGSQGKFWVQQ